MLRQPPPKYELRPYQVADLAFYINHPKCLNLSDPGTGKTPSTCAYIGDYLFGRKHTKTTWAMPKSLLEKNAAELLRFSHLSPSDVQIVDGDAATRASQLRSPAACLLMGFKRLSDDYEVLRQDKNRRACIVDEFHLGYAGVESARTANWYRYMRGMWYFVGMTGSLIDGKLSSAYPAIQVIAPHIYGNHRVFMNRHAIMDLDGQIVDWKNHEFLAEILSQVSVRHTFEEVYGEENKMVEIQDCGLTDEHYDAYMQMQNEAILDLGEEWLEAVNDGVKAIRCRQVLAHPETFGLDFGETEKDVRVKEHLAEVVESKKPLIIFASMIPELDRIYGLAKQMGLRVAVMHSRVNVDRGEIDRQFQDGELDVVCATPATAGVGFNWGHVDTMVFASIDYKDTNWVQAIRRAIRGKREVPLKVWLLRYPGTVEDKIIKSIERKSRSANKVDDTNKVIDIVGRQKEHQAKKKSKIWTPNEIGESGGSFMDLLMGDE